MYASSGLGAAAPPAQAPAPHVPPSGGRGRGRVAATVIACAVIAGGAFAVTEALSGPGQPATPAASSAALAGPGGQAAVLNGVLADTASGTPAAGTPAAARAAAARRLGRALVRLRLLGGLYGQYTFETEKGPRTLGFERGTVVSVTGGDVTVRATDGTTWTWVLTSASIVREDGSRTPAANVAANQLVFVAGQVTGTTRDARLLVIRSAPKQQA